MKKKEDKDIDPFEACGITTQNLRHLDVVYDGAADIGDFISKSSTCQKLDFFNIASRMKEKMSLDSLFILTIIAISIYPQLELLIKMRYYSLLGDIIKVLGRAYNRQMLAEEMQTFEKLFDIEATKGKDALRLPAYIGSYLVDRNADISEYLLWSDIYQITNISKEKFAELIVSPDFCTVSLMGWTCELPNILKYDGYSNILKVCKYAIRQNNKNNYCNVFDTLRDYLDMCSLCGIKHEMYPADIYKLHNELSVMKRDMEAKIENEQLKTLAGQLNKVVNKKKEGEKEPEYVIVFPSNVNDFSQEASQQHNCVGWYYHNVLRGDCIIFFVRKASSPDESFITENLAESPRL